MAVVALMVGSFVALFASAISYVLFDLSILQAIMLYFTIGFSTMVIALVLTRVSILPARTASALK